jgi:hypothetical protein
MNDPQGWKTEVLARLLDQNITFLSLLSNLFFPMPLGPWLMDADGSSLALYQEWLALHI